MLGPISRCFGLSLTLIVLALNEQLSNKDICHLADFTIAPGGDGEGGERGRDKVVPTTL